MLNALDWTGRAFPSGLWWRADGGGEWGVGRQFGSRRLLSPDDQNVRPMMEKVRGAVFSIL